jgi:hypothetical protein
MAWNAYRDIQNVPQSPVWIPVEALVEFNSFGWDIQGVRGHVFVLHESKMVIIAFKGTQVNFAGFGPAYKVGCVTEDKIAVTFNHRQSGLTLGQCIFLLLQWDQLPGKWMLASLKKL